MIRVPPVSNENVEMGGGERGRQINPRDKPPTKNDVSLENDCRHKNNHDNGLIKYTVCPIYAVTCQSMGLTDRYSN